MQCYDRRRTGTPDDQRRGRPMRTYSRCPRCGNPINRGGRSFTSDRDHGCDTYGDYLVSHKTSTVLCEQCQDAQRCERELERERQQERGRRERDRPPPKQRTYDTSPPAREQHRTQETGTQRRQGGHTFDPITDAGQTRHPRQRTPQASTTTGARRQRNRESDSPPVRAPEAKRRR
jgi:hypothetical protein